MEDIMQIFLRTYYIVHTYPRPMTRERCVILTPSYHSVSRVRGEEDQDRARGGHHIAHTRPLTHTHTDACTRTRNTITGHYHRCACLKSISSIRGYDKSFGGGSSGSESFYELPGQGLTTGIEEMNAGGWDI